MAEAPTPPVGSGATPVPTTGLELQLFAASLIDFESTLNGFFLTSRFDIDWHHDDGLDES